MEIGQQATDEVVDLVMELVKRESPSHAVGSTQELVGFVEDYLTTAGLSTRRLANGEFADCLVTDIGSGSDQILLLCHLDTVWPVGEVARRPPALDGTRLTGPGVADMKGGVALVLWLLKALVGAGASPRTRIRALFTTDEEVGSPASRELIEQESRQSLAVLVFEPGFDDGAVKTRRKGWGHVDVTVRGVAAHAGSDHELGRSAILEMSRLVQKIEAMTDYAAGVTLNVGVLRAGRQRNSVPDIAVAEVDLRVPDQDHQIAALDALQRLASSREGVSVEVRAEVNRPPFARHGGVAALYEHASALASDLGIELTEVGMGGVSDGNFSAALGIPTLDGLGPAGGGSHALPEYIDTGSIRNRLRLLYRLLTETDREALARHGCARVPVAEVAG